MRKEYVGYHGTLRRNAQDILEGEFSCHERSDHWLGQGIYFFAEHDIALHWATNNIPRPASLPQCVLKVKICADAYKVIDSTTLPGYQLLKKEYQEFAKAAPTDLKSFQQANCIFFDYLKIKNGLDLIVHAFPKKNPSYSSGYGEHKFPFSFYEVQLCLTDNRQECIVSKEVVYPDFAL